ncbi:MAG: hypothetical protein NTW08_00805 [Gammaproteobacteria bacterium]|nr:hypothetical protein [Gammaproteobacteria bacterium]
MPSMRSEKKGPACEMCRAMGLAICKGHGGGGGGGGGDSEVSSNKKEETLTKRSATPKFSPNALETQLMQNPAWKKPDELEQTFLFKDQDALFIMTIDMENNQLIFSGNKNLTENEQAALNELLDAIVHELEAFKTELTQHGESGEQFKVTRDRNTLTITCPSAKHYDAFVQRLMDKNMLPIHPKTELQKTHDKPKVEEPSSQYTTPTPFDINGPKPKK